MKVARELKYNVPETDYEQLQRELQRDTHPAEAVSEPDELDDEMSKWSEYLEDDFEESDDLDQRRRA